MKFTLTIECGNAAFEDEPLAEIARILEEQTKKIEHWVGDGSKVWDSTLYDINGNKVGKAVLTDD